MRESKEGAGGACAEVAVAGVAVTCKMPSAMSFADAAALPLAGMTALQGLRDAAKIPMQGATQRVLVNGGSGGVGHFAVQIARAMGAHVVAVTSTRNLALVRELGAHEVIDYTQPDPFAGQTPFDVVLDCVGGEASKWLPLVTPKGRYVSTMPGAEVFARGALNITCGKKVWPVLLNARAADLAVLDEMYEAGKLRVKIDSRVPARPARGRVGAEQERAHGGQDRDRRGLISRDVVGHSAAPGYAASISASDRDGASLSGSKWLAITTNLGEVAAAADGHIGHGEGCVHHARSWRGPVEV